MLSCNAVARIEENVNYLDQQIATFDTHTLNSLILSS
jgi:hypothetical protein